MFIALTFIGLPFIVRTVQPILEDLEPELEEAASSLGANRWQIFWRVIFPVVSPALLTGFTLEHLPARWANTARSFLSPATSR